MVLDQTPFYAESGGQVGDSGYLEAAGVRFDVRDTTKAGGAHLHHGVVARGNLSVGAAVKAEVDASVRQATALNHSATHLLHAALRGTGRARTTEGLAGGQPAPAFRL